jgi:hypothetical protein
MLQNNPTLTSLPDTPWNNLRSGGIDTLADELKTEA